jgi:chorismate synthase
VNTFGRLFRATTFGESHGGFVGVVVDGCPARLPLTEADVQVELDRRRPGQSALTTARREPDTCRIVSGLFEGRTLGTPIAILVANTDAHPDDYRPFKDMLRPSHADFTDLEKYGIRCWHGGGRASARETIGRVAAGAIARKLLASIGVEIVAWVDRVGALPAAVVDPSRVTTAQVEPSLVRCPDPEAARAMIARIEEVRGEGDSVGGVVAVVARGVPAGLGEPVFDKLTAELARALMSLPATRGFEIGSGFAAARQRGSEHNDPYVVEPIPEAPELPLRIRTATNRSGGIQGGISTGEEIVLRVAFKPPATIAKSQQTVTTDGRPATIEARGRHDPCVVPRAVPVCEAMVALVLIDHYLRQRAKDPARVPDLGL